MQPTATRRDHPLDRLLIGAFNGFREQFAECAEIRAGNCENTGEWSESHHRYPDQRPDQRIDATNGIEETTDAEMHEDVGNDVLRRQKTEWKGKDRR
ncbi:hypothetical protein FQZ97_829010 [compost metagenome]